MGLQGDVDHAGKNGKFLAREMIFEGGDILEFAFPQGNHRFDLPWRGVGKDNHAVADRIGAPDEGEQTISVEPAKVSVSQGRLVPAEGNQTPMQSQRRVILCDQVPAHGSSLLGILAALHTDFAPVIQADGTGQGELEDASHSLLPGVRQDGRQTRRIVVVQNQPTLEDRFDARIRNHGFPHRGCFFGGDLPFEHLEQKAATVHVHHPIH